MYPISVLLLNLRCQLSSNDCDEIATNISKRTLKGVLNFHPYKTSAKLYKKATERIKSFYNPFLRTRFRHTLNHCHRVYLRQASIKENLSFHPTGCASFLIIRPGSMGLNDFGAYFTPSFASCARSRHGSRPLTHLSYASKGALFSQPAGVVPHLLMICQGRVT